MIGRILRSADFERVLGTPIRARSAHFAVHYLAGSPSKPTKPHAKKEKPQSSMGPPASGREAHETAPSELDGFATCKLSTTEVPSGVALVDESALAGVWLGYVVPKRHARRAVTRTLLKHQIRHAAAAQAGSLPCEGLAQGLWVVRLRSPFDQKTYPSASSEALRNAAAEELHAVMADAARRVAR